MLGYTLANYGASSRLKKNAVAKQRRRVRQCRRHVPDRLEHQMGARRVQRWRLGTVRCLGSWTTSEPLVKDLKTTTARAMYNHNTTRSVWFYMYAAAKGTVYSGILPGQDDEAIAYHSSGRRSGQLGRLLLQSVRLVLQRPDHGHGGQRRRQRQVVLPLGGVPRRRRSL
ncbi:hypothetical protein LP419_07970 [Massilia sp. H-1]|nr:hypothetical protein LP419_07970 [Massilia sp. H-1]